MTLAVYALENDGCAGNGPSVLIGLLDHCQIGRYTGKVRRGCYCIAIEFRVFFFLSLFYFLLFFFFFSVSVFFTQERVSQDESASTLPNGKHVELLS